MQSYSKIHNCTNSPHTPPFIALLLCTNIEHTPFKSCMDIFDRTRLLLGPDTLGRIADKKVIVFGVGGVGSWLAECLVRSGIRHLTIVDSDRVCITNVNRQLMATSATVGLVKVEAMKSRLLDINPEVRINAVETSYNLDTADTFDLNSYDYVVDCIDSLKDKLLLIERATASSATFFSSMGAALKSDPLRVKVAEFRKVQGCPLARMLRKRIKQRGITLGKRFLCVYSDEVLPNLGSSESADPRKAQINGTLMQVTAVFGLVLGSLVIRDIAGESLYS